MLVAFHVKHVVFLVSLEDLERPIIRALKRTAKGIVANIHPAGGSQVVGLVGRKSTMELMCGWEDRAHVVLELVEKLRGHLQVPWLMRKELPRDA